jgi:type IV pilus assembly protein PilE
MSWLGRISKVWAGFLAGIALTAMSCRTRPSSFHGMTLIELVIVVAVMGILLATAVPSYRNYMLRVHRTEAIRLLLQASMCQERINARVGNYDTSLCQPKSEYQRYQMSYSSPDTQGQIYIAMATPKGAQIADPCGSLSVDQNGRRSISSLDISVMKCWNGR